MYYSSGHMPLNKDVLASAQEKVKVSNRPAHTIDKRTTVILMESVHMCVR